MSNIKIKLKEIYNMKKYFKLEELDCPNCTAKIENDVVKIDGVESAAVNLLSQKMIIECDESKVVEIVKQIKKIVKKYEPDVEVLEI